MKLTPLEKLLTPGANGVLSAQCCSKSAAHDDEELLLRMEEAGKRLRISLDLTLETITNAQRSLMFLNGSLDVRQQALIGELFELYRKNGLIIFPVVILGGRIAFHGKQPSVNEIEKALSEQIA